MKNKLRLLTESTKNLEKYLDCHMKDYNTSTEDQARQKSSIYTFNIWKAWKSLKQFIDTHNESEE